MVTYDPMWQIQGEVAARYRDSADATMIDSATYLELHEWQLRSLVELGHAPQARARYDAWLANFGGRVRVERNTVTRCRCPSGGRRMAGCCTRC